MSYLKKLVKSNKKTSGYTGRKPETWRRVERQMTSSEEEGDSVENNRSRSWILWAGGGLVVLGVGIWYWKRRKGNNQTSGQTQNGISEAKRREFERREREFEQRKPAPSKTDLDEFMERAEQDGATVKEDFYNDRR